MDSISVPFTLSYGTMGGDAIAESVLRKAHSGMVVVIGTMPGNVEVHGLVRLTGDELVLEYRAMKAQVGALFGPPRDTELHSVTIPLSAVDSISFKRRFLRKPLMVLEFNRLDVLPNEPWSRTSRIELPIARRDFDRGRELSVSLQNRLADARLRQLGA